MQQPGLAALRVPTLARDLGKVWLAIDRSVELERRVAAQYESVEALGPAIRTNAVEPGSGNRLGLEPCEQHVHLGRGERSGSGDRGLLVDVRGKRDGLDAHSPEGREPGGRR